MIAVTELIEKAIHLPRTDRSYLVKKIIESLENEESFTTEELKTFARRSLEFRDSSVKSLSLEELRRNVAAQIT
jgi:hypothetical protein